ncbi:AAA domain-containing protein [Desertivirga brevis]|uniref:AAA domain-containing protein n=1 Tax=Desertivirga brevis TaxID=2810310 RepID=UPI001A976C80|nr:AAA domain-containing protein [Pedobacter sp. SYSU D00873]
MSNTYFQNQLSLLKIEYNEDLRQYLEQTQSATISDRRALGLIWYPIAIRGTEIGRGDYITVEVERASNQDISHQFRSGSSVALFSNNDPQKCRVEGTIGYLNNNRLKITLRTDDLPDWASDGKLGVELLFDNNSYEEMEQALKQAAKLSESSPKPRLLEILTGGEKPSFQENIRYESPTLNQQQQEAVRKIMAANDLAIIHGPPGTGKTTTLVQGIKELSHREKNQILVVAPSNTAVDLLSEKLAAEGLNVLRIGNPVRVSEKLVSLTLDAKIAEHPSMKDAKKLKKQASEYVNMAHKYKRNFGKAEREQRKALFDEAYKIQKEVNQIEQFIADDLISKAQIITATLVGANHYSVRGLKYETVVIDEAGQALEPGSWIPILKAKKIVLAGDHCQLPPTIKSEEAAKKGLNTTLLEKLVKYHPEAVTLLEEQYRMNSLIMAYSSRVFYDNKLVAHPSVANRVISPDEQALSYIDTAGCGFNEVKEGASLNNPDEAAFLVNHLAGISAKFSEETSVAIISPYREQVLLLKNLILENPDLEPFHKNISINTIDSFQGQERDIVYISMTRSNEDSSIGFLSDIRRMNVAMTRARKKLVVIGDSVTLSRHPFYSNFIEHTEKENSYQSAWEFIN